MANTKEFRILKDKAYEAYLSGKTDAAELAVIFNTRKATVVKWIKDGGWEKIRKEEDNLEHDIRIARRKALKRAYEAYAADPTNVALQSLVSMMRQEAHRDEPSKELNDYIVKFQDQTTDFMIEKGYDGLLKQYQAILIDLSDYLRVRNS